MADLERAVSFPPPWMGEIGTACDVSANNGIRSDGRWIPRATRGWMYWWQARATITGALRLFEKRRSWANGRCHGESDRFRRHFHSAQWHRHVWGL